MEGKEGRKRAKEERSAPNRSRTAADWHTARGPWAPNPAVRTTSGWVARRMFGSGDNTLSYRAVSGMCTGAQIALRYGVAFLASYWVGGAASYVLSMDQTSYWSSYEGASKIDRVDSTLCFSCLKMRAHLTTLSPPSCGKEWRSLYTGGMGGDPLGGEPGYRDYRHV
ncbi:hypothetical protein An12g08470 [Aspergillus niger]|uniref:Uncharacterized protein n=2 Tax=Aspergillus niger TaxID=5061 RepID=A2R0F9_ASPNC|nr:hypothetical protein An12g08470 [Aspergillus niger]CAK41297.1 hypothetical protein An12g08470 [Aspergillus niger]